MGWERTDALKPVHYSQSNFILWISKSDEFSLIEISYAPNDVGCYDLKWRYESLLLYDLEFIPSHKATHRTMQNGVLCWLSTRASRAWREEWGTVIFGSTSSRELVYKPLLMGKWINENHQNGWKPLNFLMRWESMRLTAWERAFLTWNLEGFCPEIYI